MISLIRFSILDRFVYSSFNSFALMETKWSLEGWIVCLLGYTRVSGLLSHSISRLLFPLLDHHLPLVNGRGVFQRAGTW